MTTTPAPHPATPGPAEVDERFAAPRTALDVAAWHTDAVERRRDAVAFPVDGRPVGVSAQAPGCPMQRVVAVPDVPDAPHGPGSPGVPELVVGRVRVTRPARQGRSTTSA